MKPTAGLFAVLFAPFLLASSLLATGPLQFNVTDARGKNPGVTIEASAPDASGWSHLEITKSKAKSEPVLIWPMEAAAAPPDGPAPIPVIVIQKGDTKALQNTRVIAAIACPIVLGIETIEEASRATGFDTTALEKALAALAGDKGAFESGVGLLYSHKDATASLATALRDRQRQLTRIPSEIYPLALLYGHALIATGQFDLAAVEFETALKLRPGDERAHAARNQALVKAGKSDAAH